MNALSPRVDTAASFGYGFAMIRQDYAPPGWPPHVSLTVGWDDGLKSYFGLVIDRSGEDATGRVTASFGDTPPHFKDLDNLTRVINGRLRDRLPAVRLPRELRRKLEQDAESKDPIITNIDLLPPGEYSPPGESVRDTLIRRPADELGTCIGYVDAYDLQAVLDDMAALVNRLDRLYRTKRSACPGGAEDDELRRIRHQADKLAAVCDVVSMFVQVPGILVARLALAPFQAVADEAGRFLKTDRADAAATS